MTQYKRREHDRRSRLGNWHSVQEHEVERNDWPSSAQFDSNWDTQRRLERGLLKQWGLPDQRTCCFVCPNATCPVCKKRVFFYQNEFGSRVYFDELGPPWPKHPCTDIQTSRKRERAFPFVRVEEERVMLIDAVKVLRENLNGPFRDKYRKSPWQALGVRKHFRDGKKALIVADWLENPKRKPFCFTTEVPKTRLQEGSPFFFRALTVSYLNPKTLEEERSVIKPMPDLLDLVDRLKSG